MGIDGVIITRRINVLQFNEQLQKPSQDSLRYTTNHVFGILRDKIVEKYNVLVKQRLYDQQWIGEWYATNSPAGHWNVESIVALKQRL